MPLAVVFVIHLILEFFEHISNALQLKKHLILKKNSFFQDQDSRIIS